MEELKILQVSTALDVGGAERVVLELAQGLAERKHLVGIVYLLDKTKLRDQYKDLNIPFINLKIKKNNPITFIRAIFKLLEVVRSNEVQVLHAHMFHSLILCLFVKLFKRNIKLVFTSHNFLGFNIFRHNFIKYTRKFRDVDVIFSEKQHNEINAKNNIIIGNGVKKTSLKKINKNEEKIFINVGSLTKQKNHKALINAFLKLNDENTHLWIVGDGPLRSEIELQIKELDLTNRIKLWGLQKDVRSLLEKADCFVLSSLWEGLPLVVLEAAMVGLPVISTPVGAVSELLDNDRGYIINNESLEHAMRKVLLSYDDAVKKSHILREYVMRFHSVDIMIENHINLYNSLISEA